MGFNSAFKGLRKVVNHVVPGRINVDVAGQAVLLTLMLVVITTRWTSIVTSTLGSLT